MPSVNSFIVSPCSNPELGLDDVLREYARIGFRKFEVFSGWVKSAADVNGAPDEYLQALARNGMQAVSFHLPAITDDVEASLETVVRGAKFAKAIGASIVLYKATSRPNYVRGAARFLDAMDELGLVPVVQNHAGSPLSSLEDVREVLDGIADARMRALLEVGHFHSVGVSWRQGYELLGDRIALVHIKDQIGKQSVPFGTGEIDLPGLFEQMDRAGYTGDYVVEMEVADRENTLRYLAEALEYVKGYCDGQGNQTND